MVANNIYEFNFAQQPPHDMRFQVQRSHKTSFAPDEWVIIRIYYPVKNTIRVRFKNQKIEPT